MHPYARLPARVRRPASSPDVILPYLAIPGYPSPSPPSHVADTDATTEETARSNFRPSKTGSEPFLPHDDEIVSYVSYSLTPNLKGRFFYT